MKTVLTLIFIILIQNFSLGQDTARVTFKIMTIPTQYIFHDFPLYFEKAIKRKAFGLTVSYRPSLKNSGEIHGGAGLAGYYIDQNFLNAMYNAITVGLNAKYFLHKRKNMFLEADFFYRYWWFNNKNCHYDNVEGYRFNATRTEKQDVYGLKFLFGNSFQSKAKSRNKLVLDLYCGVGLRFKTYVFETRNGTVNDIYYSYKKETGSTASPQGRIMSGIPVSPQGGIRLGIGR